ncbi:hypothetical protein [Peristeroidobacter agariperforans]|uniref:hypothetical protein n=1 Tax=Peristeroidobacter agariperforans TaxID=268404 RepID=UPI00101BBC69|nr:hypothetical protein [Peristeroidobacter agariperforans]
MTAGNASVLSMIGVPNPHLFFRERQRCRAVSTACPDAQDGRETEDGPSRYVTDLSGWELPRTQALEDQLLEELVTKTRGRAPTPEVLREELYGVFLSHLREIAGAAVDETIEYWLKGLAEGFNGTYPELCVEFSYLQHDECVDALTIDYCVDNQDGTRTRLHCTNVRTAM